MNDSEKITLPACEYCREIHIGERVFTYDGRGVNGCGEYRPRLATFPPDMSRDDREKIGPLLAAAPRLLEALLIALPYVTDALDSPDFKGGHVRRDYREIMAALAAAGVK